MGFAFSCRSRVGPANDILKGVPCGEDEASFRREKGHYLGPWAVLYMKVEK